MEWRESFELGVPEIDGDHFTMLEVIKSIRSAASAQNRKRCERWLDRLIHFTELHFAREEALLERWCFPGLETHARYHAGLMGRAKDVRKVCTTIETPEEFQKCCEQMMSFLVDDVIRGDMKLKSFLENEGLCLPRQRNNQNSPEA